MNSTTTALFLRVLRKRIADGRVVVANEAAMQESIEKILGSIEYVEREYRLGAKDRVDFFVRDPFGLAIELKLARSGGSTASVARQLERYASHDEVHALVLITSSYELAVMTPHEIGEKPVHIINTGAAF